MKITSFITEERLRSADAVFRFNGEHTICKESITQHSWWVTMFTTIILDSIFNREADKQKHFIMAFKLSTLNEAIMHDTVDEIHTGDILHQFKHNVASGDQVVEAIESYVSKSKEEMLHNMSCDEDESEEAERFFLGQIDTYGYVGNIVKDQLLRSSIVKIADWLSCMKYCANEMSLGNLSFIKIMNLSKVKLLKHIEEKFQPQYLDFCMRNGLFYNSNFIKQISSNIKSI